MFLVTIPPTRIPPYHLTTTPLEYLIVFGKEHIMPGYVQNKAKILSQPSQRES